MEPTEHNPVTRRLHSLGEQPIDTEVVARHRTLMASVPVASSRSRLRPLMAGSLLAGSLLGGMGLAAAAPGVPDSASDAAKTVLATMTFGAVDHPDHEKSAKVAKVAKADDTERAPEAKAAAQAAKEERKAARQSSATHGVTRSTVGCPTGFTGNHGQYVSSIANTPGVTEEQKTAAAQSDCGKPVNSVHPKPAHEDNANKPETSGKSDDDHGNGTSEPDATVENGKSGEPGKHGNERAVESVEQHRKANAGRSAGHGPATNTR